MARWNSCNVLHVGPEARQLWRFDARKDEFVLDGESTTRNGESLPARHISKTWRSLWQKKLNVAWLPPEHVFLRAVQLPQAGFDETRSMVELQLEKLSPLPVAQIVWSLHVLSSAPGNQQTVLVTIVARTQVETFLGTLEGQGYLADRLELAVLDQLEKVPANRDGAWLYPNTTGGLNTALVAWWFNGTLEHLGLVSAPPGANRGEALGAQLAQMAWAGELEGWLKGAPRLYLVADTDTAAEWEPLLRGSLDEFAEVIQPSPAADLAAATAKRAARAAPKASLLPAEIGTRYHQQFVDRLWMRSLGAVLGVYVVGVLIYLAAVQVKLYFVSDKESEVARMGTTYTNALQLKARYQILKDRQDLKFAALECWKAVAELLPVDVMLQGFDFREGKKLVLNGSASATQEAAVLDFNQKLRKAQLAGQPLFASFGEYHSRRAPDGTVAWDFSCELNRVEAP